MMFLWFATDGHLCSIDELNLHYTDVCLLADLFKFAKIVNLLRKYFSNRLNFKDTVAIYQIHKLVHISLIPLAKSKSRKISHIFIYVRRLPTSTPL